MALHLTNDHHIRTALVNRLHAGYAKDPETLVLEELGLRNGAARVDVVVVNCILHGFEIKSDRDTLERLRDQARIYSSVFDYVTLVVGYRHAYEALQIVPEWWGAKLVEMGPHGEMYFSEARSTCNNPSPDVHAIASLLWRDEALSFLEELKAADGVRSKPRAAIYTRLAEVAPLDMIRSRVCYQLKHRTAWRSGAQQTLCGD